MKDFSRAGLVRPDDHEIVSQIKSARRMGGRRMMNGVASSKPTTRPPAGSAIESVSDDAAKPTAASGIERFRQILELTGPAILLPIPAGKKRPTESGWQNFGVAEMDNADYLARFESGNVGVLLGKPSGNLCSIDLDDEKFIAPFLEVNPLLRTTLQTKRLRGCNFWLRIAGDCPPLKILHHARLKNEKGKPLQIGEWRSTGGQTVIDGEVDGLKYQRLVESKPVKIPFSEITWPEWIADPPTLAPAKTTPATSPDSLGSLDAAKLENVVSLPGGVIRAACPACREAGEDSTGDHLQIKPDGRFGCAKYSADHEHRKQIWKLAGQSAGDVRGGFVASKDETEFEFANRLAAALPPIKTCGSTWHAYHQGAWHKTERACFRPKAQAILPEVIRTARRESTLLDHLEGRCQVNESDFAGFYKFGPGGEILINIANGVLAVKPNGKKELLDHSPDYLFTLRVAATFDPRADMPIFRRILGELLPDDDDRKLLQLFSGYVLLPDCRFEAALVSYGEAGRGKSTVAEAIANALGGDLVTRLTMSQVCDPKSYHVPKLRFAAVNLATELDTVELGDSGVFKAIVSGEAIEARPIYGSPFTMRPACKLMFLANSLPRFKHGTEAELRRSRFLRFDVLPAQKDVALKSKLASERDGIFLWVLEGLIELLTLPEMPIGGRASRNVHDRFQISNDPVGAFLTIRCHLSPEAKTPKDELRNAFAEFCERHELSASCGDWFLKSLYERWPQLRETRLTADNGNRYRAVAGIALRQ